MSVDGADEIERCTGERRHTKNYQTGIPTKIKATKFALLLRSSMTFLPISLDDWNALLREISCLG